MDCIFCKIIAGEIPSNKVYEDDKILAFHDINPEAPVHVLVVPKKHFANIIDGVPAEVLASIAKAAGVTNGYRVVSNCGPDAAQSVPHLHFHILGGKQLPAHIV